MDGPDRVDNREYYYKKCLWSLFVAFQESKSLWDIYLPNPSVLYPIAESQNLQVLITLQVGSAALLHQCRKLVVQLRGMVTRTAETGHLDSKPDLGWRFEIWAEEGSGRATAHSRKESCGAAEAGGAHFHPLRTIGIRRISKWVHLSSSVSEVDTVEEWVAEDERDMRPLSRNELTW